MHKRVASILFFLLLIGLAVKAQFTLSGIVKDDKETIPGAAIYIAGTKTSTLTNTEGRFSFNNLPPGNYNILIQVIGYLPYSKSITITDKAVYFEALVIANPVSLKEVVIKPDPNRLGFLRLFTELFVGITPNAKNCKILNTEVLNFNYDKAKKLLSVYSDEFLIIENQTLGYRIRYLLKYFEFSYEDKMMFYAGYPFYEEMKGSKAKQRKWQKNRNVAYYGSSQHFLKSLYNGTAYSEGFKIHKLITIANKNRQPDSVINVNIKRLTSGQNEIKKLTFNKNDSVNFWLKERSKPKKLNVLNNQDVLLDTLVKTIDKEYKSINFTDELFVVYTKETETKEYDELHFKVARPIQIGNHQVSIVTLFEAPIIFSENGLATNPKGLFCKGFWAYEKIADSVPTGFEPYP